jgi:hypothetical protein
MARLVVYVKRMRPGNLCRVSLTRTGRQAVTICYEDGGRLLVGREFSPSEQVKLEITSRELHEEEDHAD